MGPQAWDISMPFNLKENMELEHTDGHDGERAEKGSKRFRDLQLTIFLSGLSVFAQLYLFQPLLSTVARDFGTSVGDSSLLVSSSTLGMAIGLLFFAFVADSFSRKNQMLFALVLSSLLTIVSAFVHDLPLLIAIGTLKGFVIAGVSAVALAYLSEEVKLSVMSLAIGMYLNGNTIGGMSGRIVATILDGQVGWRDTVLLIGVSSLLLSIVFWRYFPASRFFVPQKTDFGLKFRQMKSFIFDAELLRLYTVAFLLMGVFVSIYNYLTYRLEHSPFSLHHVFIAFIFLMYVFGVFGTTIVGRLSQRVSPRALLIVSIIVMIIGVVLLLSTHLFIFVGGIGLLTFSFFASHTMASRMVALRAEAGKSSATSLYWLFYYLGSAILGSSTGYFLNASSWSSFVWLLVVLVTLALVVVW